MLVDIQRLSGVVKHGPATQMGIVLPANCRNISIHTTKQASYLGRWPGGQSCRILMSFAIQDTWHFHAISSVLIRKIPEDDVPDLEIAVD